MFAVTILGNNSALPAYGRHPTAQVVNYNNEESILVDCGEGTQIQMEKYGINWNKIKIILISHLHGDHFLGLPGFLNTMNLMGRTKDLVLYGSPELKQILDLHFSISKITLSYNLFFYSIPDKSSLLFEDDKFIIHSFPTEHRINCHGFVISTKEKLRRLLPDKAQAYNIPATFYNQLKEGKDYIKEDGTVIPNIEVTEAPPQPKKYAFCADTRYIETFIKDIKNANLIYHESTYLDDLRDKAYERFHSTAKQAAQIAILANAKQLLIGHFSSMYRDLDPFLLEARTVFENTELAIEGATFEIH